MPRLPVEVLDNIIGLALALGILTINDISLICHRWKLRYQGVLFKSIKLDPFSDKILDLDDPCHGHLIPYIGDIRVVSRSDSSTPPDYDRDLTAPFTNFLRNAQNITSMVFCDARIQWENVSPASSDAFRAVFQRSSFRSLELSVDAAVPSWMLLYGASVACDLTVHCIGSIMPPPDPTELASSSCSLRRLMLFGNSSVKQMTLFCLLQRALAKALTQNVVHLVLEYSETSALFDSPITPYAEMLLAFLAPQLEVLELRVGSCDTLPSHISEPATQHLKALQHLTIRLTGPLGSSADPTNTLVSATSYMGSILSSLPSPSLLKSLSLSIDDRTRLYAGIDVYTSKCRRLLNYIHKQLSCPKQWPHLTSTHISINVNDDDFAGTLFKRVTKRFRTRERVTTLLLYVNVLKTDNFDGSVTPQIR